MPYTCPTHGVQPLMGVHVNVTVSNPPEDCDAFFLSGPVVRSYCLHCWVDFLDANIEQLTPVEE